MKDSSNNESSIQRPSSIEELNAYWQKLAEKKGAKLLLNEQKNPFLILNVSPDFVRRHKEWQERQRRKRGK